VRIRAKDRKQPVNINGHAFSIEKVKTLRFTSTIEAPKPGGHYSQAVTANGFVFVAGQLPIVTGTQPPKIPDGIEAQTLQALSNVAAILKAAGSNMSNVVSATLYITDVSHWPQVNEVFAEVFGEHRPARAMVTSPTLHFGALIEVQVIATL
jgi:2-iminobutanoate/2-iminopropanoate deaminase